MLQLRHFAARHFAALRLPLQQEEEEELHRYYGGGKKQKGLTIQEVLAKWEWLNSIRKQSADSAVEGSVGAVRGISHGDDHREIEDDEMVAMTFAVLELGI